MISKLILFALSATCVSALAAPTQDLGIHADESTFKQIFEQNLSTNQAQIRARRTASAMELSIASLSLSEARIANGYYEVNYADQTKSLPMLRLYMGGELARFKSVRIEPFASLGFAYREDILEAQGIRGGTYRDVLKLQWAPLQIGTKASLQLGSSLRAFARVGASYEWVSISGSLDGISQSYWASSYSGSLGLSAFTPAQTELETWFGGVSLSYGQSRPFKSEGNGLAYSQLELGVIFNL